jgi:UDP-glucose 4-epimerase
MDRIKILITGATGYIGSSLNTALKHKYEIFTISKNEVNLIDSNKVNEYFLDKYFDIIIHCAIEGGNRLEKESWHMMDSNLQMYYNLLQNKKHFGKLIQFGSGAEFSQSNKPYGLSKKVISKSIQDQDHFYNLRIYAVFDELELDRRFIKSNIKRYINKEDIQIHQDKYMSFFYMQDLIKLVELYIVNNNLPKQVDCTYEDTLTLKQISEFINSLDDYKVNVNTQKPGLDGGYIGFNKILKLDYIGLQQGIINTYNKLKCNQ